MMAKAITACFLAGILIASAGFSGCGNYKHDRKEAAERLLENKYGKDFVVISYEGQQAFSEEYVVTAYDREYPDLPFQMTVEGDGGPGAGFSDTYVTKRICSEISDQVSSNLRGIHGDVYVNTSLMIPEMKLDDPDMSFRDFILRFPENELQIRVFVDTEDTNDLYHQLEGMLDGLEEASGMVYLYQPDAKAMKKIRACAESNTALHADFKEIAEKYQTGSAHFDHGYLPKDALLPY